MNCGKKVRLKPHRGKPRERLRIEPAGNLRPPEVQGADVSHYRAAHHDVVEVGDHEIGVMDVNVQAEGGEEKPGEAADHEQANEAERIDHRRIPGDRALVERRSPVKNFYRRRNGHEVAEKRKGERNVGGLAGNKHVMRPNEEADDRDGDTGASDEGIAKNGFAGEGRDNLADYAHGRKNHDVHDGVRIKPEQMLKKNGIATQSGVEEAQVKQALKADEQQGDGDDGGGENHDQAGGVVRPNEKRQAEPSHSRGAHSVDGDDEIQPGQNR